MADANADKPSSTGPPPNPKRAQSQGLALLPYLIKYFKTAGLSCLIWGVGYMQWSPSWVLLILFMYMINNEYKKMRAGQLKYAKEALTNEKEAILARIEELPSWVFFPDVERAEWLNKMIKQMWPYINEYLENVLKTSVQGSVENSLPKSLKPFKFEKIDFGDVPPRLGGIKVYVENVKRDEIIMDCEIFWASDCNIKMAVKGVTSGIKDLTMHGHMRVVMKPLCNKMPIIGGLNVFFLTQPEIDFDLTNMANVLDVPLLSNTLRSVLLDQLSYYLVLPNKIPVQLIENIDLEVFKYPLPQGVLRLHIVAGRDLKRADFKVVGKGKSDPYCKIYVGAQTFKTKVIKDSVNPTWNVYYEAVVDQKQGQMVEIECLDEDPGDDDELGTATIDIGNVAKSGTIDTWLPLEGVETGMIHVRALWLHMSKDPADLEKAMSANSKTEKDSGPTSEEHLASALLMVNVDSAKNLPRSKRSMSEPSPFVKLMVGNLTEKSIPKAKTTDPKWEENFQFLVNDPRHQDLNLEIWDSNKDKKLGYVTVPLKNVLGAPNMTINRPFQVHGAGPQSKLILRLCMRVLTSELPADWACDNVAEDMPDKKEDVGGSDVDGAPTVEDVGGSSVDDPEPKPQDTKKKKVPTATLR